MNGYVQISLKEMVEQMGEDWAKARLSEFLCPLNKDVEEFLRFKAIIFAQQNIAPTHLVFASYKDKWKLAGYFTLCIKSISVKKNSLSRDLRDRIKKFAVYYDDDKSYKLPAPLIAQLGKNYNQECDKLITGDELLKMACDKTKQVQGIVGGKVVYIECEDKSSITEFYRRNGFFNFGNRQIEKSEKDTLYGEYLVQMLKYLK